ncbi:MAG: porin [bacterium]
MKKTLVYLVASLVVLMFTVPASATIEWSGQIMAGIEKMDYGTPTTPSGTVSDELQFSNIKLNLDVKADVCDGVVGVAQLRSTCEVCNVTKRCVYVEITDRIIPDASLQIGRVDLPLGAEYQKASENANTMHNPLIFNSVLADDMADFAIDDGLLMSKTMGGVDCKLGITNGYGNCGKRNCKDTNGEKAITLNLSGDCPAIPGLTLGATYHTDDCADQVNETDEGDLWIIDAAYASGLWKFAAALGNLEIKGGIANYIITDDIDYLVLELVYGNGETPWWVAARYSTKEPNTSLSGYSITDPKDDEERLELGAGYKLCDNAYLKIEYIDNEVDDNIKYLDDYDGIKAIVNINL